MTNNKQQTAIQKFWDKIALKLSVEQVEEFIPLLKESKKMDKEQKINDFKHAQVLHAIGDETRAEQWYEQTYGGNK
jgi:hypothetical protein